MLAFTNTVLPEFGWFFLLCITGSRCPENHLVLRLPSQNPPRVALDRRHYKVSSTDSTNLDLAY